MFRQFGQSFLVLFHLLLLYGFGPIHRLHYPGDAGEHQQDKQAVDDRASDGLAKNARPAMAFCGRQGHKAENETNDYEQCGKKAQNDHGGPLAPHQRLQKNTDGKGKEWRANTERSRLFGE